MEPTSGVVSANGSLRGAAREFVLGVSVSDGEKRDTAELRLVVQPVNLHQPTFILPALPNATVEVPEVSQTPWDTWGH